MNNIEFSNQFDILYNNVMSDAAPGLNEYEKSYFLTKAQDELIKNYFNPKGNKYQEGIDDSTKRQIGFAKLIKSFNPVLYDDIDGYTKLNRFSKMFVAPPFDPKVNNITDEILPTSEVMFILSELAYVTMDGINRDIEVVPIDYVEYSRFAGAKHYVFPNKNKAWRVLQVYKNSYIFELIKPMCVWQQYTIRYVKKPKPIILTNLNDLNGYGEDETITNGITINGLYEETECELDEVLHEEILQRAVELAKGKYIDATFNTSVSLGQRSE